ncbi:Predicted protein [Moritella viscosa]|uniref:Uncharacterized protein n=1 Tax=Moritella viscosa TaxID=80854 RepID=A0A090IA88_9GAMM|nr:hypothetical protein [Moritella viscosa]CED58880.1 membrane protein [Moritella viscosa]SGY85780.1 Predicted protein [Moritella viscosa]SHN98268.1 Predicted protein [Moritella viscosa]SHN98269.1 Predicted protein [Moritella viscosa]SHN98289.1 Predicted protein [Moritella viscosa]
MSVDIDKYKCLYEYEKNLFEEESGRYRRLEDKAMKYLSATTLAIGAYLFLVRGIIEELIPPNNYIEWFVLISVGLTFIAFISSWSLIFRAIKLTDIVKMPSDEKTINYFKDNDLDTVYLGLSKQYSNGIKVIEKNYENKLKLVRIAYSDIMFTGWSLVVSIIFILILKWST